MASSVSQWALFLNMKDHKIEHEANNIVTKDNITDVDDGHSAEMKAGIVDGHIHGAVERSSGSADGISVSPVSGGMESGMVQYQAVGTAVKDQSSTS